jgi:predicted RNase H-like nuclease (RuvC/YqgF family)
MKALLLFLLDWLRQQLDPDYAADLAKYQAQREEQAVLIEAQSEALREETERLVQLQAARTEIEGQIEDTKAAIAELERRREEVRDEVKTKLDAIRHGDADDLRPAPL